MKKLLPGLVFCCAVANAEPLKVSVTDFNFTYQNPHGEGTASSFTRNKLSANEVKVNVDRIDQDLKFLVSGSENLEFELKDAPAFLVDAEAMAVSGLNLTLAERLQLVLGRGQFTSSKETLQLNGLGLECDRSLATEELVDQLLVGCLQSMSFKTSSFSSQGLEESFLGFVRASLKSAVQDKSDLKVNSLNFKSKSGKYDLVADVKAQVNGKVKSTGVLSYDTKSRVLTVKVSEVRFGILNITGKVFDELRKNESEKLKVKEPFVYYSLK